MLSVETPLSPIVQPPKDLVPSRYAIQIGKIEALVISDGVLPLPTATMATNADPADLANWLDYMCMPPDAFDWPLNVMVARSGDQTILIDAGLGGQFSGFPRAGQLPQRLEAAGIAPEDRHAALEEEVDEETARAAALAFARRRRMGPWAAELATGEARARAIAAMIRAGHDQGLARAIISAPPGDMNGD